MLVPPASASLPSHDAHRSPHHRGLLLRCVVRIDVHESEDQAKDASPSADDDVVLRSVHALRGAMPTTFPFLATSGHPLSPARLFAVVDATTR